MAGQLMLLSANPKRRKSGKRRSAAQRAATAKLVAMNKGRKSRRARSRPATAAPRSARRVTRRSRRSAGMGFSRSGAVDMLKNGAISGAGAVAGDVLFGQLAKVLPDNTISKVNADGSVNFLHYGAKAAMAVGIGIFGRRILPGALPAKIADGILTVSAYELVKSMLPASLAVAGVGRTGRVGYMNPARVLRGAGAGKIVQLPTRNGMGVIVNAPASTGAALYNNGRMR